ncbi:MAG TPA: hypothetical protein VNP72_11400, partial [Longimicrobium sp.]|nr:hypothetical protein [Longimicrobium sp.]
DRLKRVEVVVQNGQAPLPAALPAEWLSVERAGQRVSFLMSGAGEPAGGGSLRRWFPEPARIDLRDASLREIFLALAQGEARPGRIQEVA